MPYNVTVSTGDLADKAAMIQRDAATLEAWLAKLTNRLADLASTWTGPASSAFQNSYETWKGTAQQVQQNLQAMEASLRVATSPYDEAESALREQWL